MDGVAPGNDTIAAIATAPGRGGIGVVRVSGPSLLPFARALSGREPRPRHATLVRFLDRAGAPVDEGLLIHFPAPASFTGEDVLELQGHGGPVVMRLLLERCFELGARPAAPGEFSQRAFLNGRMDLAQAEAVADLIDASTAEAARSAVRSLGGEFSQRIEGLRDELIDLRMLVEATLDFPEEENDFLQQARAFERLDAIESRLDGVLRAAGQGALLREGIRVVLAGLPNVGKSSLLNRLSGEERAIVTDIAGTTRDVLRETIQIEGVPLHLVDTAGLRATENPVERIGVERSWAEIAKADVVVHLVDARAGWSPADDEIDARLPSDLPRLRVFNKVDLVDEAALDRRHDLLMSAVRGDGIDELRRKLLKIVGWFPGQEDVFIARERHLLALRETAGYLATARDHAHSLDLFAEELRLAHDALGKITGAFTPDDLLGVIFSRFCIGK
ncbi:tRNA uridine-5-carboxymethylaminomethyl(34) synthesis GTPase MnmE [Pseudazoarcus pumilus]|uniref:tRNA modification GTPase MnmE n=1 Tax=Pseudazoarcus pumilus TaxID=2067960 RepID=A0A2I6SB73_9RHOO|nr:tRNA uridine-5-carboxymethylaminomethyl(34) synthesis GTPase MnmE [Pseudazoarcus pumilus]AUN96511.1 tRNA uridine-5-carboxymethylaminomethyl(34) synthesis GTPase MnmE [Pseudazoarcus pumilus]